MLIKFQQPRWTRDEEMSLEFGRLREDGRRAHPFETAIDERRKRTYREFEVSFSPDGVLRSLQGGRGAPKYNAYQSAATTAVARTATRLCFQRNRMVTVSGIYLSSFPLGSAFQYPSALTKQTNAFVVPLRTPGQSNILCVSYRKNV